MVIIPAIDILDGKCVRLTQGNYDSVTEYEKDPVAVAKEFEQQGAGRIHIVDLDGARGINRGNRKKIRKIRKGVRCRLQLGGGIRSEDDIEEFFDLGIDRLVLGTVFVRNPGLVEGWIAHYGNQFLIGIDSRDGTVRISGWEEESKYSDFELAEKAKAVGACGIVYTNIDKDGTLNGPDTARTNEIARRSGIPVILSGGISSEADVVEVIESHGPGVEAIILGKALYEHAIDLGKLLRLPGVTSPESVEW